MKKDFRLFLLDNYDSFTFNLAHQIARVAESLVVGQNTEQIPELVVRRNDKVSIEEIRDFNPTCLFISPGPGRPEESGITLDLLNTLRDAPESNSIPVFGVCLGHQALIAAEGGEVGQAIEPLHGSSSTISLTTHSHPLLRGLPAQLRVGRYHSLIARPPLPACFIPLAYSEQGEIMAVAHRELPWWGVQFHPESFLTEHGDTIIHNALTQAREYTCR
jgi:anthranilate synthase/aminodeoxychorismate synthase-like glutamine amidotransferase